MTNKKQSFVWLFMDKVSPEAVQCKLCQQRLGYCSSTSNMRRHIQMKHPEQHDTVAKHVKERFGGREDLLEEAVKKYIEKSSPSTYSCSLCLSVFRNVKDTTHLMQHFNSKHSREVKELEASMNATAAESAPVQNDTDEDEVQSDSDEDYVPYSETRSAKKSQPQKSVNQNQTEWFDETGVQNGRVQKEQRRPVHWGFKRKSVSIVWSFMTKVAPKGTICQLCGKHFSFHSSTSNMQNHIKKQHPQELELVLQGGTLDLPSITVSSAVNEMKQEIVAPETATQLDQIVDEVLNHEERDKVDIEETSPFFKKKPVSIVWRFMVRISLHKTMCRLCKKTFNYRMGSTSNMHKHVESTHPLEVAQVKAGEDPAHLPLQKAIVSSPVKTTQSKLLVPGKILNQSKSLQLQGPRTQQLEYFVNLIVNGMYPCSMVERESFTKFVHMLNPKFFIPDKNKVVQAMTNLYRQQRQLLQKQLDEVPGISLSTEIWTYRERQQYLTVTAHFVSDTWEAQSAILNTVLLDSRVNLSASIAKRLEEVIRQWNIFDKIKCIVINGTDNLTTAMNQLNKPHVCCMAFALNVTVQESLKTSDDVGYLAKRVRDVVSFFVHSEEASEKLRKLQLLEGKTPQKLIQDVESDWISTYNMFKSYMELHVHLGPATHGITAENILLAAEELELLTRCVQILKPFALAAHDLASDSFTPLSKSLPVLNIIKQMISNLSKDDQEEGVIQYCSAIAFTKDLFDRLDKWISVIGDRQHFLPWAATLLDPRFKPMVLEDPEIQRWVETQLGQTMAPNNNPEGSKQLEAISKVSEDVDANVNLLWSSFDETIKRCVQEEPVDELQRYVDERPITRQEDPFKWWMEREHLYPKLCTVVKQFLSIPATSVPSGQVFLESERRNLSLRNFIEETQLDNVLFLSTCQILT
ncbi:zinc finger BED domain-containing protein 4 [Elysia marginata]|uniref:Zinc finger BED domain-containing protein 4 n=1 Tax=Elysia marginata TaxID=1093978 RepID=A0AAV4FDQ6_9GAST|nr:zinc finger BED domain-containing protein 4 [Elysia marginata]